MKVKKRLVLRGWVQDLLLDVLGLIALISLIQIIVMLYLIFYGG